MRAGITSRSSTAEPASLDSPAAPLASTERLSRRGLITAGSAFACSAAFGGCISRSGAPGLVPPPELVWGRRGLADGRFLKPRALTIDAEDNLYIVDTTGRIQVFDRDGHLIRLWKTPETKNGRPTGLAYTRFGDRERILVADTHYYRMLVYGLDGEIMPEEQIGGTHGDAPGEFAFVTDAVRDESGNTYIGEYSFRDRIQKFDGNGRFVCMFGSTGKRPGEFVRPQSLVVDGSTLLVVDSCNHRIQRFATDGETPELVGHWGREGKRPGELYYPYDAVVDHDGTLVVVEYGGQRLQRFTPDGEWIATWGRSGFAAGELYQPWGLVVDSQGAIHVLDSNNHRVQRIRMPGSKVVTS